MTIKLNVKNLNDELVRGLEQLKTGYDFVFDTSGYTLNVVKHENPTLSVKLADQQIDIAYNQAASFYRGIGHVLQALKQGQSELNIEEAVQFDMNGLMFDCSRNGVLNIKTIETLLQKLALVGQNTFMLYMEDVYEIKEQPYFGYRRGRYSHEELRHVDEYAKNLGIEVIPCIQTLAHINQFFRWSAASKYRDIDDILLVGDEEVKTLIHQMFSNLSACFTSNRIHVGMDEAYNLGRGRYIDRFGLESKVEIMQKHLKTVREIAAEYQKDIIIWDDMFYRDYAVKDATGEINLDNVNLMYWDYYSEDPAHYQTHIEKRKALTENVMFAGGAWKWMGYVPHHTKTLNSNNASLAICKKLGVKDVLVTSWGDDGSESPADSCLFGAVLYGEHGYHETFDLARFSEKLEFITGLSYDAHMLIDKIDLPEIDTITPFSNLSKYVLYQDVLQPLCETHLLDIDLNKHFKEIKEGLLKLSTPSLSVQMYTALVEILELKWNLGTQLKTAYLQNDLAKLAQLIEVIDHLITKFEVFKAVYAKVWHDCYKPQGYEVIDIRLSGVVGRLKTAKQYIQEFVDGNIAQIELFDEVELPYYEGREGLISLNQYGLIASASRLSW